MHSSLLLVVVYFFFFQLISAQRFSQVVPPDRHADKVGKASKMNLANDVWWLPDWLKPWGHHPHRPVSSAVVSATSTIPTSNNPQGSTSLTSMMTTLTMTTMDTTFATISSASTPELSASIITDSLPTIPIIQSNVMSTETTIPVESNPIPIINPPTEPITVPIVSITTVIVPSNSAGSSSSKPTDIVATTSLPTSSLFADGSPTSTENPPSTLFNSDSILPPISSSAESILPVSSPTVSILPISSLFTDSIPFIPSTATLSSSITTIDTTLSWPTESSIMTTTISMISSNSVPTTTYIHTSTVVIPPMMTTSVVAIPSSTLDGSSNVFPTTTTDVIMPPVNPSDTTTPEFPLVTTTIIRINGHTSIPVLTATYAYAQSTDVTLATSPTTFTLFNSTHSSTIFSEATQEGDTIATPMATGTVDNMDILRGAQSNETLIDECWVNLFKDLTTMAYEYPGPWGELVVAVPNGSSASMRTIHLTSLEERGMSIKGLENLVSRVALILRGFACLPFRMVVVENRGIIIMANH